jgi:drug/metabolite transporter (DMT)-like permease
MKHVSAVQSSTVIFASAGIVYGFLTFIKGPQFPQSSTGWYALVGMILIATIVAVVAFLAGLEIVGPTNAAMLSTLEPIVTVLLSAWIFSERLSVIALFGGGLILAAVIIVARAELKSNKEQPA